MAPAAPLVSVVITCYNSARFLAYALTSVVTQNYPAIEVIVVDDGSSDATSSIAQSFPVKYVYQANQGVSAARNTGIFHSRGKYLLFLDHDDGLLPNAVEAGVRLLEEHPESPMAVGEHRYITTDGKVVGYSNKHVMGRHYLALLEHNFIETPCSVLHRRSALPTTSVFDDTVHGAEDYELYLRLTRPGDFIVHEACVAEYRLHHSSLSRDAERMLSATYRVLQMELPHIQGDGKKMRHHHRGVMFVQRHFGRRLMRELIHTAALTTPEAQRKLQLLRHHYPMGWVAVALSRLLPTRLLNTLISGSAHLAGENSA